MKRLYTSTLSLLAACFLLVGTLSAQITSGRVYVGYAQLDDMIYEYDGLSLDHSARVGCAIKILPEQLKPYAGGTIVAMRVGWDTSTQSGNVSCFVRNDFNGEDLSTGSGTVNYDYSRQASGYGWNQITMSEYVIPDEPETLVAGYFTNLQKDVCAIPTLYPHNTSNSCYLWVEGENDEEGNPAWADLNDRGILPILLVVQDTKGTFNNVAAVGMLNSDPVAYTGDAMSVLMTIRNLGSQPIKSIELTTKLGTDTWSQSLELSSPIAVGKKSGVFTAPVYCFRSGTDTLSITKVNGETNAYADTTLVPILGVPELVADEYERRPVFEYFVSENSYMYPRYFEEYVQPGLEEYKDKITLVFQHVDDQFMTGDDDATTMLLDFWEYNYGRVGIPCSMMDRSSYVSNPQFQRGQMQNPLYDTLMPQIVAPYYEAVLLVPTFANVQAEGEAKDDALTINVSGNVAPGILPEGETPRLTVYLMERNVESDSQMFWTDKEKEAHLAAYTHPNIIREVLTDGIYGSDITPDENGDFTWTAQTEVYPEYNKENLYIVAFVNRSNAKGVKERNIINSCEGEITFDETGINATTTTKSAEAGKAYDLLGRRISEPQHGIFIVNGKKVVK